MNNEKYQKTIDEFLGNMKEIRDKKGKEYANSDTDVLNNFKRDGGTAGIVPEANLITHAGKHWSSINNYIKRLGKGENVAVLETSEPIEGRMMDMANYMLLLNALIIERKKNSNLQVDNPGDLKVEKPGDLKVDD